MGDEKSVSVAIEPVLLDNPFLTSRERCGKDPDAEARHLTHETLNFMGDSGCWQIRLRAWASSPVAFLSLLAIACIAVYLPSRNGPFVFDDIRNIVDNPHVRMTRLDPASLWRAMVPYANLNLRPLSFLTFALNHLFGGYAPFGYHLVNLAVLLLSIPIAYLLALRLGRAWLPSREAQAAALGAMAIWAMHPLLTNGVSYVVQRMTGLYTLFSLAALLFFLGGRRSGRPVPYALAAASLLCAFASKETALFTPLLAVLILWLLPREEGGVGARAGWALAGLVVASQAVVAPAAQYALRIRWIPAQPFTIWERFLTEGRVVLRYLELFILPLPSKLTFDYEFPLSSSLLAPPSTLLAAAFHAALIAVAVRMRRQRPLFTFGIIGFYLLQLPEGTFMPLELIYEHRAYFPAFFLALASMDLLLWGIGRLGARHAARGALAVAVATGALWGGFGYRRNQVWAEPVKLWEDSVAKQPNNSRAQYNLGTTYVELGNPEKAVGYLREAIRLKPEFPEALNNLGNLLVELGDPGQAAGYLQESVRLRPNYADALNNLGKACSQLGDSEKAVGYLQEAIRLEPEFPEALNNLGSVYGTLGRFEEAAGYFRRAIAARPNYAAAHFNLGIMLLKLGRVAEATAAWRALQQIDPALALKLRGHMLGTGG